MIRDNIIELFSRDLPHVKINSSAEFLEKYGNDTLKLIKGSPLLITFPKTTEEVKQIVDFANKNMIGIVPSGGRTGLSGGAIGFKNEIIVSLEIMNKLIEFNEVESTLEVEAGMITQSLQDMARANNLYFPIDYAAVGSSQIGGNIATNAGGIHVIKYGMTRSWVMGLTVVTGNGDILKLNKGLIKNNAGLDFTNLFIGSEGILGIITQAIIRLTEIPKNQKAFFVGFNSLKNVTEILNVVKKKTRLLAFEFFTQTALEYALEEDTFSYVLEEKHKYYVIFEIEGTNDISYDSELTDDIVSSLFNEELINEGIIGANHADRSLIWKHREHIPISLNKHYPYKNDISVRIKDIPDFIKNLDTLLDSKYNELVVAWFGHIGDGNLHVNIPKPIGLSIQEFKSICDDLSEDIYKLIQKYEGSISAEHGVGLIKKKFLHFSKSPVEIELMKSIKKIFDPKGIMNPNKVI